ncbi:MAG: tRNA epoxyqueuosine(34) reductase QueG [Acidimicrobiia bacterium]|nr:tRNA epoxyqueuosine(34) reductase QueG [Acidimicrobiia bacterium]NNL28804.1 tRNA epoxyqueuosine(34) reductase QueG [Acidimicrobiia bacterium]
MKRATTSDTLRRIGGEDLVAVGVCSAEPFPDVEAELLRRKTSGLSSRLTFTFNRPSVSTDVRKSFPWAERIVVGAATYLPEAGSPEGSPGETGRVARFATDDHYEPLRIGLLAIADHLISQGWNAEVLVDDNRLVDRAAAVRAGVGWWGKSSMVLAPKYGPWILLGSVVTDAPLAVDTPMERSCGSCVACIPACPTGAIIAPGVIDARLCLAAILQAPGPIPVELRRAVGDRVYGCDDCLDACPPGERWLAGSTIDRGTPSLIGILNASDEELLRVYDHFYVPKRDPNYLRRNALVALGNNGGADALEAARTYLDHDSGMLREHASWAIAEIEARC